ncbi:MAG: von Willebrand factor type A domain-containing protein [Chloroflexota bacterium]
MNDHYQELGKVLKTYTQSISALDDKPVDAQPGPLAFGEYLSAAIDASGLLRSKVAEAAGLTLVTLYALERGLIPAQEIQRETIGKLAQILQEEATLFDLLFEQDTPNRPSFHQDVTEKDEEEQQLSLLLTDGEQVQPLARSSMNKHSPNRSATSASGSQRTGRIFRFSQVSRQSKSFMVASTLAAALVFVVLLINRSTFLVPAQTGSSNIHLESLTILATAEMASTVVPQAQNASEHLRQDSSNTSAQINLSQENSVNTSASQRMAIQPTLPNPTATPVAIAQSLPSIQNSVQSSAPKRGAADAVVEEAAAVPAPAAAVAAASEPESNRGVFLSQTESEQVSQAALPTASPTPLSTATPAPPTPASESLIVNQNLAQQTDLSGLNSSQQQNAYPKPATGNVVTDEAFTVSITTQDGTIIYQGSEIPANLRANYAYAFTNRTSTPSNMIFYDYGVNSFMPTAADNLSTFAVDVDTGSYSIVRNYIDQGLLPPPDAVRVEEFVNYFDYGYAIPSKEEVFTIQMDQASSPFTEVTADPSNVQMLRIGIQGYEVLESERPDVALTFVIDVSGSMNDGGRLTLVKRALTLLVEQLRPTDSVGIIVYSTNARLLLPSTKGTEKNLILDAIYSLQPEDSTNVAEGLQLGYEQAWGRFNERAVNRVILVSDGVANVGATDPEAVLQQITQYADRGIPLTTVGVGMGNYNDVLMEQMANRGNGTYSYVDTIDEAQRIFVDELTGTLLTIAKDTKVQVDFNPDIVSRYRLLGYENRDVADEDFRNDTVDAGEVGAGHSVTALYEVMLHPEAEGTLATVALRWQDPETDEVIEVDKAITVSPQLIELAETPLNFQLAVVAAEFAESLRSSVWVQDQEHAQEISATLLQAANRLADLLVDDPKAMELVQLIKQSERLR